MYARIYVEKQLLDNVCINNRKRHLNKYQLHILLVKTQRTIVTSAVSTLNKYFNNGTV